MTPAAGDHVPGKRERASARRRQEILDAALACFVARGYDRTTVHDVCRRAGVSTGSVYHHFGSKAEMAAAVYLRGIQDAQAFLLDTLRRAPDAEAGIRALVGGYLTWVSRNIAAATFLLHTRFAPFLGPAEARLQALNAEFEAGVTRWLSEGIAAGALPEVRWDVYWALLTGPAEQFARRWLAQRSPAALRAGRRQLGDAAWAALRALG